MATERKIWWRKVALASVGGAVVLGGLFGIVKATAAPDQPLVVSVADSGEWTRSPAPAAPSVADVARAPVAPGVVTPASAALPVPVPAAPPLPVPVPAGIEPIGSGPRSPDAGLIGSEKIPLPVPALPPLELPKVPDAPKPLLPAAPGTFPAFPPLPGGTAEPPKVPVPSTPAPAFPAVPQFVGGAQTLPPVKSADPVQPILPAKPDSSLKPANPENTLNPASPVAPAVPVSFPPAPPAGREAPGTSVDRPKPPEPAFGATDKFVFPVPAGPNPLASTPRDPAMFNLKHAAAVAVLGGAMLSAEQARSAALPPFPPIAPLTVPAAPVGADDKTATDNLKRDLDAANKKIKKLEDDVARLTELLTGKRDTDGSILQSDPGAVAEIKELKNQISKLNTELKDYKAQQTTLKPALVPELKPRGIVRVVNEYPVEISMVINEKSHRIAPSTKIEVEVPAGEFSYLLLQSGAAATRSVIKDKETVTLRIK